MFFYLIFLMNFWKLAFSKLRFYRKESLKTCTTFEEQKGTKYIQENVYFGINVFSCLSSIKPCLRFLSNCFDREIKSFYQKTSWTSSERLMYVQFTSCVYRECSNYFWNACKELISKKLNTQSSLPERFFKNTVSESLF